MFEQVKIILNDRYQSQIDRFNELKKEIEEIELNMRDKTSEVEYNNALKELNKKYGLFKRGKKEYKDALLAIQNKYFLELKEFEKMRDKYYDLVKECSSINLLFLQKKLEQLKNANSLQDIKMSEEEAQEIINGNNFN